jgi:hypothetical protein
MLKNVLRTPSGAGQEESAEWVSEDDTELVRMPVRSISIVNIEAYMDAETNLLRLRLRTAIPLQHESSRNHTRGSDEQTDPQQEGLAGPSTRTQEPGKTTTPHDTSRSAAAEGSSQGQGVTKTAKDVVFASVKNRER